MANYRIYKITKKKQQREKKMKKRKEKKNNTHSPIPQCVHTHIRADFCGKLVLRMCLSPRE